MHRKKLSSEAEIGEAEVPLLLNIVHNIELFFLFVQMPSFKKKKIITQTAACVLLFQKEYYLNASISQLGEIYVHTK